MSKTGLVVNLEKRNPDCLVPLVDSPGDGIRDIPVCMGGTAIIGCTNVAECLKSFSEYEQPAIALTVHDDKVIAVPLCWALNQIMGNAS